MDKERACVAVQINPERRRQKGRVPSGLTCLKRGRVELVLACPPKGTRKEFLVSLPERWSLVFLDSGKGGLVSWAFACSPASLPIRMKSRFLVIHSFRVYFARFILRESGRHACPGPLATPLYVAMPAWHESDVPRRCSHTWARSYAYALEAGTRAWFFSFSSLPGFLLRFSREAVRCGPICALNTRSANNSQLEVSRMVIFHFGRELIAPWKWEIAVRTLQR